jgi:hypothetical protein
MSHPQRVVWSPRDGVDLATWPYRIPAVRRATWDFLNAPVRHVQVRPQIARVGTEAGPPPRRRTRF